jgi:plasmid stabilization system protein ParE
MAEIRWTPQAADDLEAITEYIALDSEHYAKLFAIDIVAAIERLTISPKGGRIVPEVQKENVRETFFGNYRIIYRVNSSVVEILTIYHGARLLKPETIALDE